MTGHRVIAVAAIALSGACARSPGNASGAVVIGGSDVPRSITLTRQTVVVQDGARAVRSISADGATITLAASSPGAGDIRAGSVVLIRGVEVVKASAVKRDGDALVITAEPAAITDLVQNGEIRWSSAKLGFRRGTIHTVTEPPSTTAARARRGTGGPFFALTLLPPATTADGERFSGKLKGFDYEGGFSGEDDRMSADVHLYGETHGVKVDVAADGHISNFTFGGRIAIRDGKADKLNLLFDKLDGEVNLRGSVTRAAGADHGGQQLLEIPQRYEIPVIIEGIPFVVTFKFALLLNEGLTNVGGSATAAAHLKLNGSHGAEWHIPGEPKAEPVPKTEGEMSLDFDLTRSEGVGLGPQALLVAIQYPWVGLGLGFGVAHAGPFVDVVTAASTTVSGAASIIPCKRGEVYITGSVGLEAKFLLLTKSIRTPIYQKNIHKVSPNIKACQG